MLRNKYSLKAVYSEYSMPLIMWIYPSTKRSPWASIVTMLQGYGYSDPSRDKDIPFRVFAACNTRTVHYDQYYSRQYI